jgi:hypothetical protein
MLKFNIIKIKVEPLGLEFPDIFIRGLVGSLPLFSDDAMFSTIRCFDENKEFNKTYSDFYLLMISLVELYDIERFTYTHNQYALNLKNEINIKVEKLIKILQ